MRSKTIFLIVTLAMLMLAGDAWADDDRGSETITAVKGLPVIEDLFRNHKGDLIITGSNLYTGDGKGDEAFLIVTEDGYPIKVIYKSPTELIGKSNGFKEGITTVTVITHPNDDVDVLNDIRTATGFIETTCDGIQISIIYADRLNRYIQGKYYAAIEFRKAKISYREWCRQSEEFRWVCSGGRCVCEEKPKVCTTKPCLVMPRW